MKKTQRYFFLLDFNVQLPLYFYSHVALSIQASSRIQGRFLCSCLDNNFSNFCSRKECWGWLLVQFLHSWQFPGVKNSRAAATQRKWNQVGFADSSSSLLIPVIILTELWDGSAGKHCRIWFLWNTSVSIYIKSMVSYNWTLNNAKIDGFNKNPLT